MNSAEGPQYVPYQLGLPHDQRRVLHASCDWFRDFGAWPKFGQIDRSPRKAG